MRKRDSLQWLLPRVAGKRVLYIGTVDDEPENARKHPPIHRALAAQAGSLTGIYRSEQQAAELRGEALHALTGSLEDLELPERFDVVVAADTLEHLTNAGRFLAAVERHLEPGGELLVTTPNPASLVRILELVVLGASKANRAHTCWYTGQVLDQLAQRVGLQVMAGDPIDEMHKYHGAGSPRGSRSAGKRVASRLLVALNRVACRAFPQLAETYAFVLAREGPGSRS